MVVWGIASGEQRDVVRSYAEQLGITFPVLLDFDGAVNSAYDQEWPFPTGAYPQDWVIGTDGVIIYTNNTFELDEIIAAIEREL